MEVPRFKVNYLIVGAKYDVCASHLFISMLSNVKLWGCKDFPLTFDYIELSLWLSNTPASWETYKRDSLSLSV